MRNIISILMLLTVFLCSCSNNRNIEELSLVIGAGLDAGSKQDPVTGRKQLILTHQTLTEPDSGDMSASIPYKNITTTGSTIHSITRNIALKSNPIYSQHQRALLIGESASKSFPLDSIINQFSRDNEIRRSCLVFVTEGNAQNVLSIQGMSVPPINLIYELVYNQFKTNKIIDPLTLGELSGKLKTPQSFLIQRLSKIKNSVKLNGAVIVKGKHATHTLSQHQLEAVSWLTGDIKGGIVYNKHGKYPYSFEIEHVEQNVKIKIVSPHSVHFDIYVQTKGRVSEDWDTSTEALTAQNTKKIEKKTEQTIKKEADNMIDLLQHTYKADVIGLHDYVRIHQPYFWKKHQHEWDDIFSQSTIDYHIDAKVRDYGTQGRD